MDKAEAKPCALSVAPHDTDGLVFAVIPTGNRYGLRGATLHIGSFGRCDNGRISMRPIPGNIRGLRVTDIARYWWRTIDERLAIRWPVGEVPYSGPENPYIVSPVMPVRSEE